MLWSQLDKSVLMLLYWVRWFFDGRISTVSLGSRLLLIDLWNEGTVLKFSLFPFLLQHLILFNGGAFESEIVINAWSLALLIERVKLNLICGDTTILLQFSLGIVALKWAFEWVVTSLPFRIQWFLKNVTLVFGHSVITHFKGNVWLCILNSVIHHSAQV